jgi:uncharacterized protein (TIGR02145 family)
MKTKILVLFALVLSANLRAQVTIGELVEPAPGTILDLNKAVKGGLVLSSVDLPDFHTIPNGFPGIASQTDVTTSVKTGFKGALVYNTGVKSPPTGIYVWNGTNWTPVEENCTPRTPDLLTLTGPLFAKAGGDVTFLVSSGASDFCSQGETYKWYKTGAGNENYTLISGKTTSSLTTSFATVGTYKLKVEVTNRYTPTPLEKAATIEITADGLPPTPLLDASYAITGNFCYDVNELQGGTLTKTYTFTHTNDFSNLTVLNPGGIVASVSQPVVTFGTGSGSVSFTVTFVSDVKEQVIVSGAPVYVQLVVNYKNNNSVDRVAYKILKVMDGDCACPAQVPTSIHPSGWLTFQCHNLGADYDIRSDADLAGISNTNFREYHGDWYRFGASTASLVNTLANDSYSNSTEWNAKTLQDNNEDWIAANDPCPAGWRLPTDAEWAAVKDNNSYQRYVNGVPTTTGWVANNNPYPDDGYYDVMKIGDYLYLPAAGYRDIVSGELYYRGEVGWYWSSSKYYDKTLARCLSFETNVFLTTNSRKEDGFTVRCVSAE